jgi:phosphatidylinositol alpha-mannosyltransferase
MRIALVSPYALSVYGGVQEQTLAMSRELVRREHEVLIVAPDVHDHATYDTPAPIERFGRRWSMPANGSKAPLTLSPLATRRAWFAVEHFKPDVVHFHEPFAPLFGWGVLRTHHAAAVGTFHRSGAGPALRLTKPVLRLLARDIDVAVAVSETAARTINAACGLEPEILFNGFEAERFVATPRERTDEVLLITVGRLEDRKGTAHAIRAVRAHNARGARQWRLCIIGDGPQRAMLEALAAHDDMIVFLGATSDEVKRQWYRRASVLIAPALRGESFGLVLLEAMASETSVVASNIPGYREAAGGHATLFLAGDDLELERALESALENESPASIRAAREHAQRWSMASLMDGYESLYAKARHRFDPGN